VILGPSADAGFFRRAALLAACEALGRVAGDEMADADVALSLGELGYLSVLEPRSIVFGQATAFRTHKSSATLAAGRAAETVFWRHAAAGGWCLSLAAHAAVVACEMCLVVARPALAKRTFGRLLAALGALGHVAHAERLAKRHRPADDDSSTGPNVVSIDSDEPPAEPPRQPAAARRAA
jgi:hypothetical protein